jgi:hypothetical protein
MLEQQRLVEKRDIRRLFILLSSDVRESAWRKTRHCTHCFIGVVSGHCVFVNNNRIIQIASEHWLLGLDPLDWVIMLFVDLDKIIVLFECFQLPGTWDRTPVLPEPQ